MVVGCPKYIFGNFRNFLKISEKKKKILPWALPMGPSKYAPMSKNHVVRVLKRPKKRLMTREGEFGSYYRIHAVLRIWITVKSRILDLDQNWSCTGSTILDLRALLDLGSWIYAVVLGLGSWIYAVVLDLGSWIYVGVRDLGSLIYLHRSTGSRILDLRKTVSLIRLTFGF